MLKYIPLNCVQDRTWEVQKEDILILLDSQATLKVLDSNEIKSKLIWNVSEILKIWRMY